MSPGARQRQTLEQIQRMGMKAQGKLLPGQPTAKEYADKLRREQAMVCPQDYGECTAFVTNRTAKPITAYQLNKFKSLHKMTGAAKALDKQRKQIGDKKHKIKADLIKKDNETQKIIQFKETKINLYNPEDSVMIKGIPRQNSQSPDSANNSESKSESHSEKTF